MPKSVNDGVLFLSAKDLLNDGTINYDVDVKRISEEDYLRLSKKAVPQINDIIYSRIGACLGKARVVNRNVRFLVSYSCCTIRPLMIDSTFLALILDGNFVLKQAKKETQSVGVPDLGIKNIKDFLIPIPPLNEQSRIDTCLKNALSLVDNISYNATCVDEDIDVLQSRILELAIQGKLVPQDENDEPASVLLERIRAERKEKLGKKYVESYIYKGDDNCYYENMPKNWVKCRLSDIADLERGITFSASAKETIKTKKNIACIRTANVQDELDLDDLIYVDRAYTKNNERKLLRVGDIIMSSANSKELVGKSCIVKHFDGEMTFGGFVLVIRSIQIIPEFLLICLKYLFLKGAFYNESTQTTNIANISTKTIESLEISLPPLMEQQRIINKITTLFNILKDGV